MLWFRRRWRLCPHLWRLFLASFAVFYTACVFWWIRGESEREMKLAEQSKWESLKYHPPYTTDVQGKEFPQLPQTALERFTIPETDYGELTPTSVQDFVFVTAADSTFYLGLVEAVATVQENAPNVPIYVYDLGLTDIQTEVVKVWCEVVFRKFNSTGLPEHVSDLNTFAWKPLIIMEVLKEHPGVFWFDSSVRLMTSDLSPALDKILRGHGGLLFTSTSHSTYAATHPTTYTYLVPRNMSALQLQQQSAFTSALLFRTREMVRHVLHWLTLCALEESCIAPSTNRVCLFGDDKFGSYANCHRFGQSAINILLLNLYNMSSSEFYCDDPVVEIDPRGWGIRRPCTILERDGQESPQDTFEYLV